MPEVLTPPSQRVSENDFMAEAAKRYETALVKDGKVEAPPAAPPPPKPAAIAPTTPLPSSDAKPLIPDIGTPLTPPPPVVPDDPADEPATSPRAPDWAKLKESRNALRTQNAEYQRKLAELEKKQAAPVDATELQELKKQNEDYQKRLQAVAIERDPRFIAHFDGRMNAVLNQAKGIAGEGGAKIAELLQQPDSQHRTSQLEDAISSLPQISQIRIGALINQMDGINQERAAEIAKSAETFKTIQNQHAQQSKASHQKITDAMTSVVEKAKTALPVFQLREGDEPWNKSVQDRISTINHILTGNLEPEELARAATWSAAAPALLQEISARDAEIAALRKQIGGLSAANPDPSRGKGDMPAAGPDKNLSMAEAVNLKMFGRTK